MMHLSNDALVEVLVKLLMVLKSWVWMEDFYAIRWTFNLSDA